MGSSESLVVCILGMHRSGTSAMARLVNLLGVDLGPESAMDPAKADNPTGFWENLAFRELNDRLLEHFGGSWREPPTFDPGWELRCDLKVLRKEAGELIERFKGASAWGWKDPRTALTLPFWRGLVPSLRVVICMRNPLSVAASLADRNAVPTPQAVRLWRRYTMSALCESQAARRVVVHYEDLLKDWEKVLSTVASCLDLKGMAAPEQIRATAREFLRRDLQHNPVPAESVLDSTAVEPMDAALYLLLRELAEVDPSCSCLSSFGCDPYGDDSSLASRLSALLSSGKRKRQEK